MGWSGSTFTEERTLTLHSHWDNVDSLGGGRALQESGPHEHKQKRAEGAEDGMEATLTRADGVSYTTQSDWLVQSWRRPELANPTLQGGSEAREGKTWMAAHIFPLGLLTFALYLTCLCSFLSPTWDILLSFLPEKPQIRLGTLGSM